MEDIDVHAVLQVLLLLSVSNGRLLGTIIRCFEDVWHDKTMAFRG